MMETPLQRMRLLYFSFFLCALISPTLAQDDLDETAINQQLESIRQRLTALKDELNQAQGEEAKLIRELEAQDQKINQQGQLSRALKAKIDTAAEQVRVLGQQISEKSDSISSQKEQMADLLRLHIYINHDRLMKMLLLKKLNLKTKMMIKY